MRYLGYLSLNPWIAAIVILFLDAMPLFIKMRLKDAFESGKLSEDDANIMSVIKLIVGVNAVVIFSYLVGGHWGGSIILFIIGILVYIYEIMDLMKRKNNVID